jgi:hypothetical protein
VVYGQCKGALFTAMTTLTAMANPRSSFRDEFQRMGGVACVGLCYLECDEDEQLNVFTQVSDARTNCPLAIN